ncbi:ABC transporter permease, partial [Micromonospora aurantiaca]|nr:ABC transporter permease [Micromonospora aurantiaca]
VSLGTGGLAVIGGSVVIVGFMTFFTGSQVGLQGYESLNQIGTAAFTGFVASYFNTREIAPLVSALALSATVGCG